MPRLISVKIIILSLIASGVISGEFISSEAYGQDNDVEALYDKFDNSEEEKTKKNRQKRKSKSNDVDNIADLVELAPFTDVAVIQRRFLPLTNRFEVGGSGLFTTNNAFFDNNGVSAHLGFYFSEKFGVELKYSLLSSSEKDVTTGLESNQRIDTRSFVEPESYYGAAFKWVPIYGKVAWFDAKVIPFDIYFTPGIGKTNTALGVSETTYSLGTGQLFALSKSWGVRWDFTWNFYQATVEEGDADDNDLNETTKNHSDLVLSIGFSYFFPGAKYR